MIKGKGQMGRKTVMQIPPSGRGEKTDQGGKENTQKVKSYQKPLLQDFVSFASFKSTL